MSILDKDNLAWISKHKLTFTLVVLLLGNIYQYVSNEKERNKDRDDMEESIKHERKMSDRLEALLEEVVILNEKK